jgi:antitoxin ParD1/3/4
MTMTRNPDREASLETRMARGDLASIEEAARRLIDQPIAEHQLGESDAMASAKPYVEEGLAALRRGDVLTLEPTPSSPAAMKPPHPSSGQQARFNKNAANLVSPTNDSGC